MRPTTFGSAPDIGLPDSGILVDIGRCATGPTIAQLLRATRKHSHRRRRCQSTAYCPRVQAMHGIYVSSCAIRCISKSFSLASLGDLIRPTTMSSQTHGRWVQNALDPNKPPDDSDQENAGANSSSLLQVITVEHLVEVYEEYTDTAQKIIQAFEVCYMVYPIFSGAHNSATLFQRNMDDLHLAQSTLCAARHTWTQIRSYPLDVIQRNWPLVERYRL